MQLTFDLQPGDDRLFTDESLEQIERIEQGLLVLEHDLDSGTVNEVFRAAHTLKGSAATIGHRRMAELTHAMEDLFGAFRSGTLVDDEALRRRPPVHDRRAPRAGRRGRRRARPSPTTPRR